MTDGDFVSCNDDVRKIAASSAAMTGEICAAMTDVTYAAMTGGVCAKKLKIKTSNPEF